MAAPTASTTISRYQSKDADALAEIHNRAYPNKPIGPFFFSLHLDTLRSRVWTIRDDKELVGYGYVTQVPGLPGIFDLQGCIDPPKQRQGYGRLLLQKIITHLQQDGRFELSHAVPSLKTPAARFLSNQQFFLEHSERQLLLENPAAVPAASFPPDFRLATFDQDTAVQQFRTAYDDIFQKLPWYQPYTEDWEVTAELANPDALLFLCHQETIAGFAWLRFAGPHLGEIEPIGLLPAHQGQGLGQQLMAAAINHLADRGAKRVRIGAWTSNERAMRLYRQMGFKPFKTRYYLAYRYPDNPTA